jgi:hypothetical protein
MNIPVQRAVVSNEGHDDMFNAFFETLKQDPEKNRRYNHG